MSSATLPSYLRRCASASAWDWGVVALAMLVGLALPIAFVAAWGATPRQDMGAHLAFGSATMAICVLAATVIALAGRGRSATRRAHLRRVAGETVISGVLFALADLGITAAGLSSGPILLGGALWIRVGIVAGDLRFPVAGPVPDQPPGTLRRA